MSLLLLLPIFTPMLGVLSISSKNFIKTKYLYIVCLVVSMINLTFYMISGIFGFYDSFSVISLNKWIEIYFKMDVFGVIFALLSSFLWCMTSLYAGAYMKEKTDVRVFFSFFLLTQTVVMGIAMAGNLFTLYMFYELLTIVTFPLIIHTRTNEALRSGKKYIAYSFLGSTFILMGMMLVFSYAGNLTFIAGGIPNISRTMSIKELSIAMVVLFFGFGVKAAIVPFHSWMPAAMIAPSPVSALLDALAIVKSGIFGIVRTVFFVIGASNLSGLSIMNMIMAVVLVSIIFGSFTGLHQRDLKTRLAYSTISQLGYILFGIVFLNEAGIVGAMLHVVNHAFIKILLFFCIGAIIFMTGKKTIDEIGGIGKKMPLTMLCFTIATVSLIGIPPTNGFVSKWYLARSAMVAESTVNIIVLLLSAFLTAGYLLPIIISAFFTKSKEDTSDNSVANLDPPMLMLAPMIILSGIIILLGILPNPLIKYVYLGVQNLF